MVYQLCPSTEKYKTSTMSTEQNQQLRGEKQECELCFEIDIRDMQIIIVHDHSRSRQ